MGRFKKFFYFPIAWYFRFWAGIRLRRWAPRIVVVTGSNGKTTLLHLLEAQIGGRARYSHHANSSFGIPFDILGLSRKTLLRSEWIGLFLRAPLAAFAAVPEEKLYVAEVDCDRPGEGKFLGEFLRPEVVLWVSVGRTHTEKFTNYELRIANYGQGWSDMSVEERVAFEFGWLVEFCSHLAVVNGDLELAVKQVERTEAEVRLVKKAKRLEKYEVTEKGTHFIIDGRVYFFHALLPEEVFYGIVMCLEVVEYLGLSVDRSFSRFVMPPGRSSVFQGVKDTVLIDSSYNATPGSVRAVLGMYNKLEGKKKWVVIGDMIELGSLEKEEHEKLGEELVGMDVERVILMGPRVKKYTYPKLVESYKVNHESRIMNHELRIMGKGGVQRDVIIEKFLGPREVLKYLEREINGGEIILFKGARFMEGIIEGLLADKRDVAKLARREEMWEKRRKEWGV